MDFEVLGELTKVETIATGSGIREIVWAEILWYEATGIGKRELKIKRFF
jgi:hypothetical protein